MSFWSGGMLKVILSISLLFSAYEKEDFRVDKISYSASDNTGSMFYLNIDLYSAKKDIIELKIYFYDIDKNVLNNICYSSSLEVNKSKSTIAKIPYKIEEDIYLRIFILNENGKNEILNLFFPVFPKEDNVCCFLNRSCETRDVVVYSKGVIEEIKSKVFLINENTTLYSFDNRLKIERIRLSASLFKEDGYAYLSIKDKIDGINLYYNEGYQIPLSVISDKGIIYSKLENMYYLDFLKGATFENYNKDTIYMNDIVFPYFDNSHEMKLVFFDCFAGFSRVEVSFNLFIEGNLIGDCLSSKYCLRRGYL